jgi:hypothetical protein
MLIARKQGLQTTPPLIFAKARPAKQDFRQPILGLETFATNTCMCVWKAKHFWQGCQMVYFKTKLNLVKFWKVFAMRDVGLFYGHLVSFT